MSYRSEYEGGGYCTRCSQKLEAGQRCNCVEARQPTLRDQFAMAAMQGMLARSGGRTTGLTETAYYYADAMLKERSKGENSQD